MNNTQYLNQMIGYILICVDIGCKGLPHGNWLPSNYWQIKLFSSFKIDYCFWILLIENKSSLYIYDSNEIGASIALSL